MHVELTNCLPLLYLCLEMQVGPTRHIYVYRVICGLTGHIVIMISCIIWVNVCLHSINRAHVKCYYYFRIMTTRAAWCSDDGRGLINYFLHFMFFMSAIEKLCFYLNKRWYHIIYSFMFWIKYWGVIVTINPIRRFLPMVMILFNTSQFL